MAVGEYHGCAVMTDNSLWCWGLNHHGEIGVGNDHLLIHEIIRIQWRLTCNSIIQLLQLISGKESTCTLHDDGRENEYGEVGNGT